ncbi:hypothetical protein M758_4G048300 [Ceratodon purpureus]|nr:hypothetical protein M758_4G048300 [Ceratodon purpureus]
MAAWSSHLALTLPGKHHCMQGFHTAYCTRPAHAHTHRRCGQACWTNSSQTTSHYFTRYLPPSCTDATRNHISSNVVNTWSRIFINFTNTTNPAKFTSHSTSSAKTPTLLPRHLNSPTMKLTLSRVQTPRRTGETSPNADEPNSPQPQPNLQTPNATTHKNNPLKNQLPPHTHIHTHIHTHTYTCTHSQKH